MTTAHLVGGPHHGETTEIEHRQNVVECLAPMRRFLWTDPPETTMVMPRTLLYRRRRVDGPYASAFPVIFDYDGPSAYAVFLADSDDDVSPQFETPREAACWLRDRRVENVWFPPCEVRWVYPEASD